MLVEDVLRHLCDTPDPGLISEVYLLDESNPDDEYLRQTDSSFASVASMSSNKRLTLYRAEETGLSSEDILHEWCHSLFYHAPHHFHFAAWLEENGHFANDYAKSSVEENFAVHLAEELASCDLSRAELFADRAPIRAMVMIHACLTACEPIEPSRTTDRQRQIAGNMHRLVEETTRRACQRLIAEAVRSAPYQRQAIVLLLEFGTPADLTQVEPID
jgi:hypothetical protein